MTDAAPEQSGRRRPMSDAAPEQSGRRPLRLWPGVVLVFLLLPVRFILPLISTEALPVALFGALGGAFAVALWWAFFSRAAVIERIGGVVLMVLGIAGARTLLDSSMATAAMGVMYFLYVIPAVAVALVAWAVVTRGMDDRTRRASMVVTILMACGAWALVRTDGVNGSFDWDFAWRWSATAEDRLLAAVEQPAPGAARIVPAAMDTEPAWPGFRGPDRDGVVDGITIDTDWTASPPVELWRRPVGPGWSSFSVRGDVFFTQEQRGDDEVVSAYDIRTGEPVWQHSDPVRFWEAMAGAGPRSTPTLSGDRVFTLGATGIVNALDVADGSVVWSRDASADAEVAVPGWGFASSPLVLDGIVIVAVSSRLVAYDAASGERGWIGPRGGESYGSPHLMTIDGVPQVLVMTGRGVISVAPADGSLLWEHAWPGFHSLQPAMTADGDVLIASSVDSGGIGIRRLAVSLEADGWAVAEHWTSRRLKPYFNDFVVHDGYAFGFDGRILACIDLATGDRVWKGGRYGHGQLVLLPDQDVMLIVSEDGDLALVAATPDGFSELGRVPAIDGKTWNHPVLVDDILLVRNGEEMVAFRLTASATGTDPGDHDEEGGSEHGEGEDGEHGEAGHDEGGEGEEGGLYIARNANWDLTRRGARLFLSYDPDRQAFVGTVENTTESTLCAVRVEVHLNGGTELGPTERTDVAAGQTIEVELPTGGLDFESWTAHPEQSRCGS